VVNRLNSIKNSPFGKDVSQISPWHFLSCFHGAILNIRFSGKLRFGYSSKHSLINEGRAKCAEPGDRRASGVWHRPTRAGDSCWGRDILGQGTFIVIHATSETGVWR
jgi:hypothetical protein